MLHRLQVMQLNLEPLRNRGVLPAGVRVLEELSAPLEGRRLSASLAVRPAVDSGELVPFAEVKKRAYLRALELSDGNVQRPAKALGV